MRIYCGSVYSGVYEGDENMNFLKEIIHKFQHLKHITEIHENQTFLQPS